MTDLRARRSRTLPTLFAPALMALLLLAPGGCGQADGTATPPLDASAGAAAESASTSAAGAAPVPACALVTRAEAERLAGTPLGEPVSAAEACTYTGPVSGPTAQVEVYVGDGAKKQFDIESELGHQLSPFSGAGDEAYAWVDGAMVFVSKGDRWFSIRLVLLDDPAKHREPLAEQARVAAGRL